MAERLLRHRLAGGYTAGHHDRAIAFDHPPRTIAGGVGIGLGVAGNILHLFAQDTVTLKRYRLHRVEQSAIAFAVDVLDRQFITLELLQTLFCIGARLRHVKAEHRIFIARIVAEWLRVGTACEHDW